MLLLVQVLGLSFRARELTLVAAGMSPVKVTGVENVDLRSLVSAHTDYAANITAILDLRVCREMNGETHVTILRMRIE